MHKKTTLLCILDGFGLNPNPKENAVAMAKKPAFDRLWSSFPRSTLTTHGEAVGLPAGQMGNSEVGHLNIGAGRVIEQWLLRIGRALKGSFLNDNSAYQNFLAAAKKAGGKMHLIGLFSDGGVHSHNQHLYLLLDRLKADFQGQIVLHLITDGRDTAPNLAAALIDELVNKLPDYPGCSIGTICGRFYAMDRDKRWERTEKAANAIALSEGAKSSGPKSYIETSYAAGTTDEFLEPLCVTESRIAPNDSLLFWNFREDRMRQIVRALCIPDAEFNGFERRYPVLPKERVLCFTEYDKSFHLPFLFPILDITNHLGETVSKQGLTQLRVAESEKYPHVTYFLNGGIEQPYPGEERKLLPSPRDVKTYDLKPEMSAYAVADTVIEGISSGKYDLIIVNFANCDMVGHTGVTEAAVRAVEAVDLCLGRLMEALRNAGGQALIIADHGNAEQMADYTTGTPHTAHTTYPVPVILVSDHFTGPALREGGTLCDVAPTILKMMDIPRPAEMTGTPLF